MVRAQEGLVLALCSALCALNSEPFAALRASFRPVSHIC